MSDLENVIEDAVNDSIETPTSDDVSDVSPETIQESVPDIDVSAESSEVSAPSIVKSQPEEVITSPSPQDDEFTKRFGISSKSITGRENRIPYSRVKKIIEKNEKDVAAKITKEVESVWQPKFQEVETKVKDYEDKLTRVAEFEQVMVNEPKRFLEEYLSRLPAYKPFFDYVNQLAAGSAPQPPTQPVHDDDPRPLPNKQLADGSKVYDLEGLDALMAWQARQVEKKVSTQLEERVSKRYAPIEEEWKRRDYVAKMTPVIDQQIAEARTWPHFSDHEEEIVKILQADQKISLEGAYRKVMQSTILPKLSADRNKVRTEVIAELQRQPKTTSAPITRTAPGIPAGGKRSIEDIIAEEIRKAGG